MKMLVVHQTIQLKVDHSDITFALGIYRHGTTDVPWRFPRFVHCQKDQRILFASANQDIKYRSVRQLLSGQVVGLSQVAIRLAVE